MNNIVFFYNICEFGEALKIAKARLHQDQNFFNNPIAGSSDYDEMAALVRVVNTFGWALLA